MVTLFLILIVVIIIVLTSKNNKNPNQFQNGTYDTNIYQNVEKVRALEAKNAELSTTLQEGLTSDNSDLAELKRIQAEISANKAEIQKLQNEDYARVNQEQTKIEQVKKEQSEKSKQAGSAALLYVGSLLFIAGFCGLLGFSGISNFVIIMIFIVIFVILGAVLRLNNNEGLTSLSNGALYVVMTLTPFAIGNFCSLTKIPMMQSYGFMMITLFLVFFFISRWIKTSLSTVIALITSLFIPTAFVALLGIEQTGTFFAISVFLMAIYSIVLSFIASSKTLSKEYTSTATALAIISVASNIFTETIMIGVQVFSRQAFGMLEIWVLIISAIIDIVHQFVWAGWMKNQAILSTARFSLLMIGNIITYLVFSCFGSFTYINGLNITITILLLMAAYSMISLFVKASVADAEAKKSHYILEMSTAIICTVFAVIVSLFVDDICRIVVSIIATVIAFILFAIAKNYDNAEANHSENLKELSIYAAAYAIMTGVNVTINAVGGTSVDAIALKWVLSLHIICLPVFLMGLVKKSQAREIVASTILIFGMCVLANTDLYAKSAILALLTVLCLAEAVFMTAFGFISKRTWMGVIGIMALFSFILRYTGQYMLFWFVIFGIILLGVAIYSAIATSQKKQ